MDTTRSDRMHPKAGVRSTHLLPILCSRVTLAGEAQCYAAFAVYYMWAVMAVSYDLIFRVC